MSVMRVAIQTDPRENDRSVSQSRKGCRSEASHCFFLAVRHHSLRRTRMHLSAGPMIRNFHDSIAVDRKTVVTGSRDVRAKHRKTFGAERMRISWFEMKNGVTGRSEEVASKRKQIRRPRAGGHDHNVSRNHIAVGQNYPSHLAADFI